MLREIMRMNDYIKVSDVAEKWGIRARRFFVLCNQGRIEGVVKFGNNWAIPEDVEKPKDARIKSGKYVKKKDE